MKTRKNVNLLGLLALIGILLSGAVFVLADDTLNEDLPCDGSGHYGILDGKGFWSQLSMEQRDLLYDEAQSMLEAGASQGEIREMKVSMLEEWGIDAPMWNGPYSGEQAGGYGKMTLNVQGNGIKFRGRGYGGQSSGLRRQLHNGVCAKTG